MHTAENNSTYQILTHFSENQTIDDQLTDDQASDPGCTPELFDIQASAAPTRKRHGEIAEAAFLAKASSLGFGVAKPWGDSERYDFILDFGHGFWRVQVKSTQRYAESRYRVKAAGWKDTYSRDEIDFLVAYIVPEELWYVVPIQAFANRKGLRFYPHGGRNSLFEKYRDAWCLMACPHPAVNEDAPASTLWTHTPTTCHAESLPLRCPRCPNRT